MEEQLPVNACMAESLSDSNHADSDACKSTEKARRPAFPDGHFYSPVVDIDQAERDQPRIWPERTEVLGIDFREHYQRTLLESDFARFIPQYDYPDEPIAEGNMYQFFTNNPHFSHMDSRMLFVMLRKFRPCRMIEVGSGFSSLLTADVNRRFLKGSLKFICVEPYPDPVLRSPVPGISQVIQTKVEDVPISLFETLQSGDFLFVDSSHVSKTGSDVNHIIFEILPRLGRGVIIHFHDIFLPADYPKEWVIIERRSWNEQYLIRALLMFTNAFEIMFGSAYAYHVLPELLTRVAGKQYGGGSLWIRKVV